MIYDFLHDPGRDGGVVRSYQVDVLVVGFGAAGAAAAITAADRGASVMILEKQPEGDHIPSTAMSGGVVMGASDVELATSYLDRCAAGKVPIEVTAAWANAATKVACWLDQIGTDLRLCRVQGGEHGSFEGVDAIDVYRSARLTDGSPTEFQADRISELLETPNLATGLQLFEALATAVRSRPRIQVLWGSPAAQLTRGDGGTVTGAEIGGPNPGVVNASRGTILTCGGYEFNRDLKIHAFRETGWHFYSTPANTGDGVRMAQAVGADLWHMDLVSGRAVANFTTSDGLELNFRTILGPGGYVIVDRYGRRFVNEELHSTHYFSYYLTVFDPKTHDYPRIPCYWIFDARRILTPLVVTNRGMAIGGVYDWTRDNSKELAAGWIHSGRTIAEVAERVGISDPEAAELTVSEYNSACTSGGADEFGRSHREMEPILEAPFYCLPLYPGGSHTSGGPRRDAKARVLDPFGTPIRGLYGAGELGQAIGLLPPSPGSNLSEALCFGRIAAETAIGDS